jgi:peptide methionine sulfoxide reductase MsrA
MSLILFHSEEQKQIAEQSRDHEAKVRAPEKIITEIRKAGEFYAAEE